MARSLNPSRAQFKALVMLIIDAFDQAELAMLLKLECGKSLAALVSLPARWGPLVTEVVDQAERQGFTDELLLAVAAWRPHSVALSALLRELMELPGRGDALAVSDTARAGQAPAVALEGLVRGKAAYADVDQFLSDLAAIAARVCRMEALGAPGEAPQACGTGFLVGDDLVLTNKHVHDELAPQAAHVGCRFDHRVLAGSVAVRPGTVATAAAPNGWVAMSDYAPSDVCEGGAPPTAAQLDYGLLRLGEPLGRYPRGQSMEGAAGEGRGHLRLDAPAAVPQPGDDIFVLQHPDGAPMKLAVGRVVAGAPPCRLWHDAPTEGGSSGSPCFNHALQLVALHHATDPRDPDRPRFNQAVPIGLIAADLKAQGRL